MSRGANERLESELSAGLEGRWGEGECVGGSRFAVTDGGRSRRVDVVASVRRSSGPTEAIRTGGRAGGGGPAEKARWGSSQALSDQEAGRAV